MRTIVHLSDLHFGRIDPAVCGALVEDVSALNPDLLVVSGDLTQRARKHEFQEARAFLERLPFPQVVVPGNHDIPLYNLVARFLWPLTRYRRYITPDLKPFYADSEVAVAGINTARSFTFKNGRVNREQMDWAHQRFGDQPSTVTRIVVTHHPFEGAGADGDDSIVGRASMAVEAFSRSRVEMILSGHLHLGRFGESTVRYKIKNYSALLIQAGTAISSRRRLEENSFNVIRIDRPRIDLECRTWDGSSGFVTTSIRAFGYSTVGWVPVDGKPVAIVGQSSLAPANSSPA